MVCAFLGLTMSLSFTQPDKVCLWLAFTIKCFSSETVRISHGQPVGNPWPSHGQPVGSAWDPTGSPWTVQGQPMGISTCYGLAVGSTWATHAHTMGSP